MSGRNSPTSNSYHSDSRDLSPYMPSDQENQAAAGGDSDDSQSTYLECQNQEHFYKKYYERTGRMPVGYGVTTPPKIDEDLELEAEVTGPQTEIPHSRYETPTILNTNRSHKRWRHIDDLNGDKSDKENLSTPSTRRTKRARKEHDAVILLQGVVRLSQKAVDLSAEAVSLSQSALSLLEVND